MYASLTLGIGNAKLETCSQSHYIDIFKLSGYNVNRRRSLEKSKANLKVPIRGGGLAVRVPHTLATKPPTVVRIVFVANFVPG